MATAAPIVVPGGGQVRFQLAPGDRVRIVDPEGLQPGVLVRHSPAGDDTIALFGDVAGAEHAFVAVAPTAITLAAPGAAMAPDAQDAPTDLLVHIVRADPADDLPAPLAEPLLDLRVPDRRAHV